MSTELLPENPAETVMETIMSLETESQSVNFEEDIATTVGLVQRLEGEGVVESNLASEHASQQIVHEEQADANYATAENASNEAVYHSSATKVDMHTSEAETHNVLSHSAAVISEKSLTDASAMEQIATVQYAVQQETERLVAGQVEVQNRTSAAVEQEMKVMGAVAEEAAAPSEDLEAELVAVAAPKA